MGEARPRPRTEVEGPSSRVPESLSELAPGGGEGASASVQRFRDARVFLLTRWHCLQWGTQLGTGLSIRAPATFLCVLWGWGWGMGDVHSADGEAVECPSSFWQKSHLNPGLCKGGRDRGQPSTHKIVNSQLSGDLPREWTLKRRLLSSDHIGAPGCQVLGFLCLSPFCLADTFPREQCSGPTSPINPEAVSPCFWAVASNVILQGTANPPCWEFSQSWGSSGKKNSFPDLCR